MNTKEILIELTSKRETKINTGISFPEAKEGKKYPLVFMMDGYLGNRNADGFFYGGMMGIAGIAEEICESGIASVRLDFPGCGESKEGFASYTIENMLDDVETVYDYMKANYPVDLDRIGMCCWSNGGRIGVLFAGRHPEVKTMVLWAPVAANGDYMWPHIVSVLDPEFQEMGLTEEEYYRKLWNTAKKYGQAEVTLPDRSGKIPLSLGFFEGNYSAKPLDVLQKFNGNVLILVAGQDTCVSKNVFEEIIDNTEVNWVVLDRADHDFGAATQNSRLIKIVHELSVSYIQTYI
jgi:hypothetical protein